MQNRVGVSLLDYQKYNNRDKIGKVKIGKVKIGNTILNMLFNGENGIKNIENEIQY